MARKDISQVDDAFQAEVLRSEQRRVVWLLSAITVIFLFGVIRNLSFFRGQDLFRFGQDLLRFGGPILVAAVLYAFVQRRMIARALRLHRRVPGWLWSVNTILDALFPTIMVFAMGAAAAVGPHRALFYPVICTYFIAIALSTLRLQPRLSCLSGLVSAGGYLGATACFYASDGPGAEALHPAVYATYAAMMVVAGVVSGGVAGQLRRSVRAALEQAEARRRSEIESRNTLIFGLAKLAEYRDSDTGRHLERIADYCALLAVALQDSHPEITGAWIEQLPVAATLHDIGKVGLPDQVLKKPGPLTAEERVAMQAHSALGAAALASIRQRGRDNALLVISQRIAAAHHERWDGAGYPRGLRAHDIPLAARIVAVADVYDALTSERVYKPALSHAAAAELIRSGRGTHFDPLVVEAFERQAGEFAAARQRHMQEAGAGTDVQGAGKGV